MAQMRATGLQLNWSRVMRRLTEAMEARARMRSSRAMLEAPADEPILSGPPRVGPPEDGRRNGWRLADRFAPRWARYRRPAIAFAAGIGAVVFLGGLLHRPMYPASAMIAIDENANNEWELVMLESHVAGLEEQVESRGVLEPALKELQLYPPQPKRGWFGGWRAQTPGMADGNGQLQRALDAFRARLTAHRVHGTGLLRITVQDPDAAMAAKSANTVAQSFIDYHRSQATERVEHTLAALDEEIGAVQSDLDALTVMRSEVLVDDTLLQELVRQLAAADTRLSQTLSRYKDESPTVVQARREKEALEMLLRQRTSERRVSLTERLAKEDPSASGKRVQPQAVTLDAAIEHAKQRYHDLLNKRAETHLSLTIWKQPSSSFGKFAIFDRALPPPAKSRAAGVVLALVSALLLAGASLLLVPWLLDAWDGRARPHSWAGQLRQRIARAGSVFSLAPADGHMSPQDPDQHRP